MGIGRICSRAASRWLHWRIASHHLFSDWGCVRHQIRTRHCECLRSIAELRVNVDAHVQRHLRKYPNDPDPFEADARHGESDRSR